MGVFNLHTSIFWIEKKCMMLLVLVLHLPSGSQFDLHFLFLYFSAHITVYILSF